MDHAFEATCCRTALLLGLVTGDAVHRWAQRVIEHESQPAAALLDLASLPSTDLTGLRHALWPLVVDPEPAPVLEALLGMLYRDLASGRRDLHDTRTILRQMRSMLRLPPTLYADLNSALVDQAEERAGIEQWLQRFAGSRLPQAALPDLSGEWVLDRRASTLSPSAAGIRAGVVRIDHDEPVFRYNAEFKTDAQPLKFEYELRTDGREIVTSDRGREAVSSLRWSGDTLIFSGRHGAMTVLFRHELIDAGRRLRLVEEVRGSGHDQDNVWIYDRIPTAVQ